MRAISERLTLAVQKALEQLTAPPCPPLLAKAIEHSLLPPGSRRRPLLCYAVAGALGERNPEATDRAAVAIELLHCASLVHDDLPCFDNAPLRRGRPSVHRAYGEPLAVLAGDALIVGAFSTLSQISDPALVGKLVALLAEAAGAPLGMCAGQAWESEPQAEVDTVHRAKTASLFEASVMAGALCAGQSPEPWRPLGQYIGEAYQIADDIRDAVESEESLGKPNHQDQTLGRPSVVRALGISASLEQFETKVRAVFDSVPACPGYNELLGQLQSMLSRLRPQSEESGVKR